MATFNIFLPGGRRISYANNYDENIEHELDAAYDDVYSRFPEAEYIELF